MSAGAAALLEAHIAERQVEFVMHHANMRGGDFIKLRGGSHRLADGHVEGDDPLAPFSPLAAQHLLRADGFEHCPDLYVNSFYDHDLDEGCAFEELISFHGGMGGLQTRPFILFPKELPLPDEQIVGAAHVHELLKGWRYELAGGRPAQPAPEPAAAETPAA